MVKDICRICLQEADDQDVQEINIPKLNNLITSRPYLEFAFLEKWHLHLFQNHLICDTCIHHFRTMTTVSKQAYKSNSILQNEKKKRQLRRVNLKRLGRFSQIEGHFIVCRLCFEPTNEIAIYLYDSRKNILPMEYIVKMLRQTKIYTSFNTTVNPILCHLCWQNIQASYAFSKHLEVVTEKILYYQVLVDKMGIDREDLQNILELWDQLDIVNTNTEIEVFTNEIQVDHKREFNYGKSTMTNLGGATNTRQKKNVANIASHYFYDEHNYVRMEADVSDISVNRGEEMMGSLKRKRETKDCVQQSSYEMPKLTSNIEEEESLKMPKLKSIIETKEHEFKKIVQNKLGHKSKDTEDEERLKIITKSEREIAVRKQKEESNTQRQKLRNRKKFEVPQTENTKNQKQAKRIVKKSKIVHALPNKQNSKPNNSKDIEHLEILESVRPRTRLSTKKEITDYPILHDLLVLRKEEIIKKKRLKRKVNASFPKHTSTPKILQNASKQNVSIGTESLSSKSNTNTEYMFETFNLDDEVHVKKEVIEEEELQIKKEMLSECESDDSFTENTGCSINETEDFDEECPNLECFIKSEPSEETFLVDLDEEGPPELEFQGPCHSVPAPIPCFTIQNTFTVDEKRHLVNAADQKNMPNLVDEKAVWMKSAVNDTKSATEVKINTFTPAVIKRSFLLCAQSNLSKASKEKSELNPSRIQIKEHLVRNANPPKTMEKEVSSLYNKKLVINVTKCDERATLTFEKDKTAEDIPISNNEKVETLATTSSSHQHQAAMIDTYATVEKLDIGPEQPYYCTMCDFSTISEKATKAHIALHATNSIYLHKCELCSFASSRRAGLTVHRNQKHWESEIRRENCNYCETTLLAGSNYCLDCHKVFHPKCVIKDLKDLKFKCRHLRLTGTKYANTGIKPQLVCAFCENVILTKKWLCIDCHNAFHPGCLNKDLKQCRSNCKHPSITAILKSTIERLCDSCQKYITYGVRCPKCKKYMHNSCCEKHYSNGQLNCNVRKPEPHEQKPDTAKRNISVCNYCGIPAIKAVVCTKCKRAFHLRCFNDDLMNMRFNCKHVPPFAIGKQLLLSNATVQDHQSTSTHSSVPTTSKEVKQEMLNAI